MDNLNKNQNPDITELYIKQKELAMLLKRYENLNKQYIDLVYVKKSSKEEIDSLNIELNEVNTKLIELAKELQDLSHTLKPNTVTHTNAIKDVEKKIENLMPVLLKHQGELDVQRNELTDAIGQQDSSNVVEESSNLKYIFLLLFTIMILMASIYSLMSPTETKLELFIFSVMSFVITHQIIQAILHKTK